MDRPGLPPSRGSTVGRYRIGDLLASGGMATVNIAQVHAAGGFSRIVALKRMLPHLAADPSFASMFSDEARLAARVRHPNVVPTFDVVMDGSELCIVMEYVQGVTLSELGKRTSASGKRVPPAIALAIVRDALQGLHAAHEAIDDDGRPLGIVHRDVSPQNVLVGADGIARVLDFGIAKANARLVDTRTGDALKGKLAYMAPEQLEGTSVDRSCDVFAASVVLWEVLTGARLHSGANEGEIVTKILRAQPPLPSVAAPELGNAFDELVLRGLARAPSDRYATARDMALAVSQAGECAAAASVAEWVESLAGDLLARRASQVQALLQRSSAMSTQSESVEARGPEATASAIAAWPAPPASGTAADALPVVTDASQAIRNPSSPPRGRARARARAQTWLVGALAVAVAVGAAASVQRLASPSASSSARGADAITTSSAAPATVGAGALGAPSVVPSAAAPAGAPAAASSLPTESGARPPEPRRTSAGARGGRHPAAPAAPAIPDHL